MVAPVTVYAGSAGLNTVLDPERLMQGGQDNPGIIELAEAVNVSFDDRGLVELRRGDVLLQAGEFHSLFCDRGDCFVVQERMTDAALYRVLPDLSLLGVRSGLTKGARTAFCQVGNQTFYCNGYQNGVVKDGVSQPWPDHTEHVGAETTRQFSFAPLGQHIAYRHGRMFISSGQELWYSEPYAPGKFDLARNLFQFGRDVVMVRPVAGGIWVGIEGETGFIADEADDIAAASYQKRSNATPHEWSDCIELVDLSATGFEIQGLSALWASNDGLTIGSADGQLLVTTKNKIVYPQGTTGATVVDGGKALNMIF